MPNAYKDYGDLRVTLTSEFDWRYSDQGSGAKRDGAFWHPKPQENLRPVGSVVVAGYGNINNNFAALLVGNAREELGVEPAVRSPVRYQLVWNDQGSGADHDVGIWQPIPPDGYAALGCVAAGGYGEPSLDDVWCVRLDLVISGQFEGHSTWDDRGSGADRDGSFWQIFPRVDGTGTGSPTIPVQAGTFWANQGYGQPNGAVARVPALRAVPEPLSKNGRPPRLTEAQVPEAGEILNDTLISVTPLPFTTFFDPTDRDSLNTIQYPFLDVAKWSTWAVHRTFENLTGAAAVEKTTLEVGVPPRPEGAVSRAGITLDNTLGFELARFAISLNYQLGITETARRWLVKETVEKTVNIPPYAVVVAWVRRLRVEVRRINGTLVDTGLQPFYLNDGVTLTQIDMTA
ncbi:hypothetical protein VTJ49DRAFT_3445 [Mycothermus thermophilus]|uniref:Minor tail protein n=1 Tax=Humicola insolens TaxID=85995 RepID=A0ABR3V7G1_HUMIN